MIHTQRHNSQRPRNRRIPQERVPKHVLGLTNTFSKHTKNNTVYTEVYLTKTDVPKLFNRAGFAKKGNIIVFEASDNEIFGCEDNICSKHLKFADMYSKGLN